MLGAFRIVGADVAQELWCDEFVEAYELRVVSNLRYFADDARRIKELLYIRQVDL